MPCTCTSIKPGTTMWPLRSRRRSPEVTVRSDPLTSALLPFSITRVWLAATRSGSTRSAPARSVRMLNGKLAYHLGHAIPFRDLLCQPVDERQFLVPRPGRNLADERHSAQAKTHRQNGRG